MRPAGRNATAAPTACSASSSCAVGTPKSPSRRPLPRLQSLGSGRLLGLFGVPTAHEDDALQAVGAAVALRPAGRIGLATGEVLTGHPFVSGAPVDEPANLC